jgi:hypothetical protein
MRGVTFHSHVNSETDGVRDWAQLGRDRDGFRLLSSSGTSHFDEGQVRARR